MTARADDTSIASRGAGPGGAAGGDRRSRLRPQRRGRGPAAPRARGAVTRDRRQAGRRSKGSRRPGRSRRGRAAPRGGTARGVRGRRLSRDLARACLRSSRRWPTARRAACRSSARSEPGASREAPGGRRRRDRHQRQVHDDDADRRDAPRSGRPARPGRREHRPAAARALTVRAPDGRLRRRGLLLPARDDRPLPAGRRRADEHHPGPPRPLRRHRGVRRGQGAALRAAAAADSGHLQRGRSRPRAGRPARGALLWFRADRRVARGVSGSRGGSPSSGGARARRSARRRARAARRTTWRTPSR